MRLDGYLTILPTRPVFHSPQLYYEKSSQSEVPASPTTDNADNAVVVSEPTHKQPTREQAFKINDQQNPSLLRVICLGNYRQQSAKRISEPV